MRKSRPQLLEEFTRLLFERDPMGICYPDNPDRETEYDVEALSILARFTESHIVEMDRENAEVLAYNIVQSAFTFWFTHPLHDEAKTHELANALLDAYVAAYPEQDGEDEVGSGHEERSGDGSGGLPGIEPGETPPGSG